MKVTPIEEKIGCAKSLHLERTLAILSEITFSQVKAYPTALLCFSARWDSGSVFDNPFRM